jgi:hypothetical protein
MEWNHGQLLAVVHCMVVPSQATATKENENSSIIGEGMLFGTAS